MSRALLTFALGDYERLQRLALPGLRDYADRHGYQLDSRPPRTLERPASWGKVALLLDALDRHEEALWIDADVLIVDGSDDVADQAPPDAWQAMCRHHTADGECPNCGVWLVRQPMRPTLEALWKLDRYTHHVWWEQTGMLDLLGYRHDPRPIELVAPTELYQHTHWLDLEWNSHEQADRHPQPRFAHCTHGPIGWRLQTMQARLREEAHVA